MVRPGLELVVGALLLPLPPVCGVTLCKRLHWYMSGPSWVALHEMVTSLEEDTCPATA